MTPHQTSFYGPFHDHLSLIPVELQEIIFEPFISSKSSGSGLGLAMVASVISDHGGMVSANSRPGETVLTLNLPLQTIAYQAQHLSSEEEVR